MLSWIPRSSRAREECNDEAVDFNDTTRSSACVHTPLHRSAGLTQPRPFTHNNAIADYLKVQGAQRNQARVHAHRECSPHTSTYEMRSIIYCLAKNSKLRLQCLVRGSDPTCLDYLNHLERGKRNMHTCIHTYTHTHVHHRQDRALASLFIAFVALVSL